MIAATGGDAPRRRRGRHPLREVAVVFLKLGATAFGGPAAHIAMMEDEVVRRRRWLSREAFLDYLGVTNLIPGPNSTELAIHIGRARAGWPGLLLAGTCFILPAALLVAGIAWAYVRFGTLPAAEGLLYGVKPVVIAVVVQALWGLGRSALKSVPLAVLALVAALAAALGVNELVVLAVTGAAGPLVAGRNPGGTRAFAAAPVLGSPYLTGPPGRGSAVREMLASAATTGAIGSAGAATPIGLGVLFGIFAKIGAVLYGSGYVLLAFLEGELVRRRAWLSEQQLLDAVAVGQITPGPVFTTATFVGYVLAGGGGAAAATLGIFLPAFVFVAVSGPLVPLLRRSRVAAGVLDAVNAASLALMAVVTWQLGRAALVDGVAVVLAGVSALLLTRFRINSAWLVALGAIAGLLVAAA